MANSISVMIITFNNEQTILDCIQSVLNSKGDIEIIVVDNNSTDSTLIKLRQFEDKLILKSLDKNTGFSKANNIAAKLANGKYFVFLNPDTKLQTNQQLLDLVQVLESNPNYGLIGPKLILGNGKIQKTVRNLPSVTRAIEAYLFGNKSAYDFYIPEANDLTEVESVVGACIVIRKETFEEVKGFDEKFFLYFEDIDLCRKIKTRGLKIGFLPSVEVVHYHGVSGKNQNTNQLLVDAAKKYHGEINFYLLEIIFNLYRLKTKLLSCVFFRH